MRIDADLKRYITVLIIVAVSLSAIAILYFNYSERDEKEQKFIGYLLKVDNEDNAIPENWVIEIIFVYENSLSVPIWENARWGPSILENSYENRR